MAESELDVGIQPILDMNTPFAPPTARIFMSDSLENGAGYSTYLGQPYEFRDLLTFMLGQLGTPGTPLHQQSQEFYMPLVSAPHEPECASSCHRCLREYGNMAYHPLLDWRLALDLVRLALDPNAQIDFKVGYWSSLVTHIAGPYFAGMNMDMVTFSGLIAGVDIATSEALILIHPLWDYKDQGNFRSEVAAAVADAESQGYSWRLRTIFRAVRFPYE